MDEKELKEIRLFADQWACQKIQEKYWYAEAKRDVDMICSVFTEDARYGQANGMSEIRKMADSHMSHMGPIIENYHVLPINVDIKVNGDQAEGEIRAVAFNPIRNRDGSRKILVVGVGYYNEFVRTPDGWRIQSMRGIECGWDFPHDTTWKFVTDFAEESFAEILGG